MGFEFRSTDLYKKALEYRVHIKDLIKEEKIEYALSDQFKRAASSIVLNIAEGFGRYQRLDKRRFYIMARGSVFECVACADIWFDSQPPERFMEMSEALGKMLSGLIKRFDSTKETD